MYYDTDFWKFVPQLSPPSLLVKRKKQEHAYQKKKTPTKRLFGRRALAFFFLPGHWILKNIAAVVSPQHPRLTHRYGPKREEVQRQKKRARQQKYTKKNTAAVPPSPHASHTDIVPEGGDQTVDSPVFE